MKAFKEKGFAERRDAAAKAKEDNLKKFSRKPAPDASTVASKDGAKAGAGKSKKA